MISSRQRSNARFSRGTRQPESEAPPSQSPPKDFQKAHSGVAQVVCGSVETMRAELCSPRNDRSASITGAPGGEPTRCGVSIGDLAAARYAVVAVLAVLRVRDATGVGQHLDIAMLDCQVALLEDALARFSATGRVPGPIGSRHPSITPFQPFRASAGKFVAGCGNEAIWQRFCDAIGTNELGGDERFATNTDRTANHAELEAILARLFASNRRSYWLERLQQANVPCAPIASVDEVAANPHLHERQMILHADHLERGAEHARPEARRAHR